METKSILSEIEGVISNNSIQISEKIKQVCDILQTQVQHYDWVGFYFAEHSTKTLHLGPYAGEPTDHTVIPFGKGICGQVAESHKTFLVDDVHAQDNYIACSLNVKSEIVVPLFVNGKNAGQIDIDSHSKNAFTKDDENLLSKINNLLAHKIEIENIDLKTLWV